MKNTLRKTVKKLDYMKGEDKLKTIPLLYTYYKLTGKTKLDADEISEHDGLEALGQVMKQTLDYDPLNDALKEISTMKESEDTISDIYTILSNTLRDIADTGEYYTPIRVVNLMIELAETSLPELTEVYDPACGTGSILLDVYKNKEDVKLYGQEVNHDTCNLARLNMKLNGVPRSNYDIREGCTISHPMFDREFDLILANPPYSVKKPEDYDMRHDPMPRRYGGMTLERNMDYTFIQHMLDHVTNRGVVLTIEPMGVVLHRTPTEQKIRENLIIEHNCIDAVIKLPKKNLFRNTNVSTVIQILKKERDTDDILFVSLEDCNITSDDIRKTVETVRERRSLVDHSYNASLEEVKEKKYNLNPSLYIEYTEEDYDIQELIKEYRSIEEEKEDLIKEINQLLESLGSTYQI